MMTSFSSMSKQDLRLAALAQLQQCKEQLRALEAYSSKKIETSPSSWVSKNAVETYMQCQIFYQTMEQLISLVRKTVLPAPAAHLQSDADDAHKEPVNKARPC
jgi:hypothetical protein